MSSLYVGRRQRYTRFGKDPAQGARSEVRRVKGEDGVEYALKVPLLDGMADYARERAALLRLGELHADAADWLVTVLDEGTTEDDRPFFVMPWFPESLIEWVRRTQPDVLQLLQACERLAVSVERLHQRVDGQDGVMLHRDLKPTNVLVRETTNGVQVVLADLGLTREASGLATIGNTGVFTANYGAPEQVIPGMRVVGSAVDVHALAATIFHLLAGRPRRPLSPADFTPRFLHLTALHHQDSRTPAEQAELDELLRTPIEQLLRLERAPALGAEDRGHLERAWIPRLVDLRVPAGVAKETLAELTEVLEHALEPRPRRRLTEARVIRQTLASVRTRLEETCGAPRWATGPILTESGVEAPTDTVVPHTPAVPFAQPVPHTPAVPFAPARPLPAAPSPPVEPAAAPPAAAPRPVEEAPARRPRSSPVWMPLAALGVATALALAVFGAGWWWVARGRPVAPVEGASAEPARAVAPPVDVTIQCTDHTNATLRRAGVDGPDGPDAAFVVGEEPVEVELIPLAQDGEGDGPTQSLVLQVRATGAVRALHVRRNGVQLPECILRDGDAALVRCDARGCSVSASAAAFPDGPSAPR